MNTLSQNIEIIYGRTQKFINAQNTSPQELINEINNAGKDLISTTLKNHYLESADKKVNGFRRKVLLNLLENKKIELSDVETYVRELKSGGIHNWNSFSLIAGLYYNVFDLKSTEIELEEQITALFEELEISKEYKYKKIFNQQGAQNYGAGYFGVCFLKEKFKKNSANQIVFDISDKVATFFYDVEKKERFNLREIDYHSENVKRDIQQGYIYASEGFYEPEMKTLETLTNLKDDESELEILSSDNIEFNRFFTMRTGRKNEAYNDFVNNRMMSITFGIDRNLVGCDIDEIRKFCNSRSESKQVASMFNKFINIMQIGDIVLLLNTGTKKTQMCVITSDALYDEKLGLDYSNYRTIEILKSDVEFDFVYNVRGTIVEITSEQIVDRVNQELDDETISRYKKIMSNIDIERDFKFEFLGYDNNEVNLEDNNIEYLNDYKQLIIDGAPGTGKSYHVNKEILAGSKRYQRVTFYSDYEYHNFIGSILPRLNGETVTYEFIKGPFAKILNDALSQPEEKHYLIVEELTRGNAAAIFGDIFQLLDRTEEGWSEYPITHDNILESLDPEVRTFLENEYEGKVVLPPNLSIICTINSSDQNVYPLDTAFKRRFDYKIESTNVHKDFVDYEIKFGTDITVSWQDFYQKLNKYILVDLGLKEDKQVGPYFIKNHNGDNEKLESIQTKLAMYMWNDLHKVHTISNKTIFKDIHTLYEVDNLFRTGSREQILRILSTEFKQHFNLNDSSEQ